MIYVYLEICSRNYLVYLKLREMEESIVGIGLEDILDNWNY